MNHLNDAIHDAAVRSMFRQFVVTFITLEVAVRLVNGNSTALNTLVQDRWTTELLLDTGAKLVYMEDLNTFGVFSYYHDGYDGFAAVNAAVPSMSDVLNDNVYIELLGGPDND